MKSIYPFICLIFCNFLMQNNHSFAQNLSVGYFHTQYLCADGQAMSWGFDCDGRTGRSGPKYYPGFVNMIEGLKKVSSGGYHSLYLDSIGNVWSSGSNSYGQTGTGFSGSVPQQILILDSIIDIAAGIQHSLFLRYDGTVYACGRNISRQLGDGTNIDRYEPVLIPSLDSVIQMSAGDDYSFFVCANGEVYGCGSAAGGKLGIGPNYYSSQTSPPIKIDSLNNIRYASAGERHSLFIDNNGETFFCGENWVGQAGIGSNIDDFYYPVHINTLDSVVQVDAFEERSLFLRANGTVWISGRHANGYVGGTDYNNLITATQIPLLSGVTEIGMGTSFFVFEIGDSTLYSMGDNHSGKLGNGSTLSTNYPVQVTNLCGAPLVLPPNTASIEETSFNEIGISPNPATYQVDIQVPDNLLFENYLLLDIHGQIIQSGKAENKKFTIYVSTLDRGMYFLQFNDNKTLSQKIILN